MPLKSMLALASAAITLLGTSVEAQGRLDSITGVWTTEGAKSIVRVVPCGASVCGTIIAATSSKPGGSTPVDWHNPDPSLKGRSVVGVQILTDLHPSGDRWVDGSIYNPADGRTYAANARLEADGRLRVEGCVAVLCGSQFWTRKNGG